LRARFPENISVHQLTGIAAKHFRVFAIHLRFSMNLNDEFVLKLR